MSSTANILETFRSIQGEGKYAGVEQVFVRFFECNMHCVWCDTPHSIGDTTRHYKQYTEDALLDLIHAQLAPSVHSISITGGEPLMQTDFLEEFLPKLRREGHTIYLETNGVYPDEMARLKALVDIVSMDIKLPSSTRCKPYWAEHEAFIRAVSDMDMFIKTVITADTDAGEVEEAARLTASVNPDILFILQPNFFDMKEGSVKRCHDLLPVCRKFLSDVRILPQMHKMLKVR